MMTVEEAIALATKLKDKDVLDIARELLHIEYEGQRQGVADMSKVIDEVQASTSLI